ncbi:efflux RND transporter permease subunit [bacterium]|nr:efflux RND transporter permease subunit [bacterium]
MFSHFFIDRPVLATVLSVVIVIIGGVAMVALPIAQYPEIAPPTISITTVFPGASAKVVAETVATPIEQEVNGVENMLYMSSRATNDGALTIDVTFKLGTNLDMAQVLVQNRVAIAQPKLPDEVRRQGVTVKKRSPNILLVVNIISPNKRYDQLFLNNFAALQVKDELARIDGVGDVTSLGARDYSMRVWLDPLRLSSRGMTVGDVLSAIREQNLQVAAGRIGQPPTDHPADFQFVVNTQGRLMEEDEFGDIILKTGAAGEIVRIRDVGQVNLGAKSYDMSGFLDGEPCALLAIFPTPGANALATAEKVRATMKSIRFPEGVEYRIVYDTTVFVEESIKDVQKTLFEAFALVFIVVLIFLQSWRATILPMIEVPVSLIGTFAVMALLGFSLNNLSLFGLVLAIGIVVDDAIIVIENAERWMAQGFNAKEATKRAMLEVTGPIIATTLVLSSVFIPTAFIAGISGQFYRQFALTIAASTIISAFNALTMTPARCALILKPHAHGSRPKDILPWWGLGGLVGWGLAATLGDFLLPMAEELIQVNTDGASMEHSAEGGWIGWIVWLALFGVGFVVGGLLTKPVDAILGILLGGFNRLFDACTRIYGAIITGLLRISVIALMAYLGLMVLTYFAFQKVPVGFIPEQDQGYLVVNFQLPDGANLDRTERVAKQASEIAMKVPGVVHTVAVPGYSILTGSSISNTGVMFVSLDSFEHRRDPAKSAVAIQRKLFGAMAAIEDSFTLVFNAPPVQGIGSVGGFKMQIQDRDALGLQALDGALQTVMAKGASQPGLVGFFSTFGLNQPQLYLDIDRNKAKMMGVPLTEVFDALQGFLGSAYVNDFTRFGRNWQVNVQADSAFRARVEDIGRLRVRNSRGQMVPLDSLVVVREVSGPPIVSHYNIYPSAEINGATLPGTSSGQAINIMEQVANEELPKGMTFEWTELSLQQILAGNTAPLVFTLGTVFVFLVLAAQYESWVLPFSVVLLVPMCLSAAIFGVWFMGMDNNIFTQIGLVVLVGLASKNAILIVEFAKQLQEQGMARREATVEASRMRLRPILMTSLAFILGVVPLVRAHGAGAEMRQALGIAVFSGMIGVTFFGIFFTPVFYSVVRWWAGEPAPVASAPSVSAPPASH